MDCMTFRKLIPGYINEELDDAALNEFLVHYDSCSQCREELEINYIVMKGVDILDNDKGSYDLSSEFRKTVSKSAAYLKRKKKSMKFGYIIDALVWWCVFGSFVIFLNRYIIR